MPPIDQHEDPRQSRPPAQKVLHQAGPVGDFFLGDRGIAIARHVDEAQQRRLQIRPRLKKLRFWVRPGVCEMRASALRPVSALRSEDFPTLERPAKAISGGAIGGKPSILSAAQMKSQVCGEKLAPDFSEIAVPDRRRS